MMAFGSEFQTHGRSKAAFHAPLFCTAKQSERRRRFAFLCQLRHTVSAFCLCAPSASHQSLPEEANKETASIVWVGGCWDGEQRIMSQLHRSSWVLLERAARDGMGSTAETAASARFLVTALLPLLQKPSKYGPIFNVLPPSPRLEWMHDGLRLPLFLSLSPSGSLRIFGTKPRLDS